MMSVPEKRNSELFLRPRFSIDLNVNSGVLLQRFLEEFKKSETKVNGNIVDGHIFIAVFKKDEHFWSPQLHLEIIEETKGTSTLKGLFGPKPQVWTLFLFVHFVVGVSFLAFAVMLYTKYSLKESVLLPTVMLIVLPLVWTLLYFLGQIGKDTGKKQMQQLHNFMIKVIDN